MKIWSAENFGLGDQKFVEKWSLLDRIFQKFCSIYGELVHVVKHHAKLLRKVATQVLSNFVHLLNCCSKNGYIYINMVDVHAWFSHS